MRMAIRVDGREHPLDFDSSDVLQALWINARVLEATLKRGDRTVARGRYEPAGAILRGRASYVRQVLGLDVRVIERE
jgi:hypothetical protein